MTENDHPAIYRRIPTGETDHDGFPTYTRGERVHISDAHRRQAARDAAREAEEVSVRGFTRAERDESSEGGKHRRKGK